MKTDNITTTYIYILIDPTTNYIRYVGKTNNPKQRFQNHKNKGRDKNTHKRNWINQLRANNTNPIMEIIDEVPIDSWKYWEKFWIGYYKLIGCNLVNYTNGGDGLTFGNQTSFKKGNKTWNDGTANQCICIECGIKFKSNPSKGSKLCSLKCTSIYNSKNPNSGAFKKGFVPWNKGKKLDYELSGLKKSKLVVRVDLSSGEEKEYKSCKHASIEYNCSISNIRRCCLGHSKTAMGYFWKFKN